jgi:hypothetical protein
MPLTAYSISDKVERDVDQVLTRLSVQFGQPYTSVEAIPEAWRVFLRSDLQCPSCFVQGAEVVRSAKKAGRAGRQSFFRFTNPGHKPHCDFGGTDTANTVPENLVAFGKARTPLTRAVRQLVCTGIEKGFFSQASIRDMREWFFNKKVQSLFDVTLDSRIIKWLCDLDQASRQASRGLPPGVDLTPEIAAMPDFDWSAEAAKRVLVGDPRHQETMVAIQHQRIHWFGEVGERITSLARRFHGRTVFDPTLLANEYRLTCSLAEFIRYNYAPLKGTVGASGTVSVLAFSALLLHIRGWNISLAISDFAKIAAVAGHSNQNLGNVMGLNPFHDYLAWTGLKKIQDLNIEMPENTIKSECLAMRATLRAEFGLPPEANPASS